MSLKYEQINLIHSAYLPGVIGVGVTIEPLKEDVDVVGRCILLVKEYGLLDFVSI